MNPETKEKLTAQAKTAKDKAFAAAACCKEKIAATWKSGRKGKAICIGGAAVVLILMMQCGGGESAAGGGWEFTGKNFSSVFMGSSTQDEGVIYAHSPNISIKVLQATKKGNLVEYVQGANPFAGGFESMVGTFGGSFDRMVWVETPGKMYEDGEKLGAGYYIRRGSYEYEGVDGGEHTVARYVEVTDKDILEKIRKQIDDEKAAEAKAQLEAEGRPLELDVPVKSLCGFAVGTTPSSVLSLFEKGNVSWNSERTEIRGKLATPFRHFAEAVLSFRTDHPAGGKHLCRIKLTPVGGRSPLEGRAENYEEIKTIVAMLEKKFGIKFVFDLDSLWGRSVQATWETSGDENIYQRLEIYYNDGFLYLLFQSELMSQKEKTALEEQKKPAKLSADAGADQL